MRALSALLATLTLALAACGSQAAPAASKAASAPSDWNQVVAAANKEGSVVVIGSGNTDATEGFSKRYPGIKVFYTPITGNQLPPKVLAERTAGKHLTDVLLHGTEAMMTLGDAGALADLHGYLNGPDVNPDKWLDGKLQFADNAGKSILVYSAYVKLGPAVNVKEVDPKSITSWKDLLDPKWKGKMIAGDPNAGGAAFGMAWYWYATAGYGKPYLEQLFKQQSPTLSRNNQQAINSVAHGEHLIGIGIGDNSVAKADTQGLGSTAIPWSQLKDPPYMTAGLGALAVPEGPPHPNAARVYLDWLLSEEGQALVTGAANLPSLREDVPTEGVFPAMLPKSGVKYFTDYSEDAIREKAKNLADIKAATS